MQTTQTKYGLNDDRSDGTTRIQNLPACFQPRLVNQEEPNKCYYYHEIWKTCMARKVSCQEDGCVWTTEGIHLFLE